MMESEIQAIKPAPRFDDYFISLLSGLIVGATAWALAFGVVAIIQAAAPPGINMLETIAAMKLVPPPGIDLSPYTLTLAIQRTQVIDIVFVAVPILFGLLAGWIGYRKVLQMD